MGLRNAGCDLQLSHDGKVLDVKFGRASAKVRLGPEALVWPNAPANETVGFELSAATLVQALEDVADCCDEQSVRMVLGVVQVSIQDGALVASATDSRRLAISRREVDPWLQAKFLVPRKVVRQLASLDFEGDVRVTCGMSRCSIAGNEGGLTWSLPEGRLPKILELVPPGREGNMMVRSEELTRAVRQAAIMVDSRSDGVVLRVGDMLASLVVEGESDLGRAVLSVPLVSGGVADVAVKLSASYLLEALQHVGEEVSLDIASRNDALVVRSGGYVSVIMPRTDVGPQESES
jgi:DNA polymerase III sliding clamp (beta) subunit (PCNA family)